MTKTISRTNRASAMTKDQVLQIVSSAKQPVTVSEVFLAQTGKDRKSLVTIATALRDMVTDGTLVSRDENAREQELRGDKRGKPARFYWPADGGRMPERTVDSVLKGVSLRGSLGVASREKHRPAKGKAMQTGRLVAAHRPAKAAEVQTGNRLERLEKRITELEATIASLRKILH